MEGLGEMKKEYSLGIREKDEGRRSYGGRESERNAKLTQRKEKRQRETERKEDKE